MTHYALRNDLNWAFQGGDERRAQRAHERLSAAYAWATGGHVTDIDPARQCLKLQQLCKQALLNQELPVVLDPVCGEWSRHERLSASRMFALGPDGQERPLKLVAREGGAPLSAQFAWLRRIARGRPLRIIDDDVASGWTARALTAQGAQCGVNVQVTGLLDIRVADICDARDFMLGGRSSGLLTPAGRRPYWAGQVNLQTRASIAPERWNAFTAEVLDINAEFHRAAPRLLSEIPNGVTLALSYGMDVTAAHMTLSDFALALNDHRAGSFTAH